MKDFVDARQETVDETVRVNVPILLPGRGVIGSFGADPEEQVSGVVVTLYCIPMQPLRILRRTINKFVKPAEPISSQATLRNFEVVITDTKILYCPASPLMVKTYPPKGREAIADTTLHFESMGTKMSKLTIGSHVWHVHPEYAGDVRWALRRLADDYPSYDISFSGGELAQSDAAPAEGDAALAEASSDEVVEDRPASEEE